MHAERHPRPRRLALLRVCEGLIDFTHHFGGERGRRGGEGDDVEVVQLQVRELTIGRAGGRRISANRPGPTMLCLRSSLCLIFMYVFLMLFPLTPHRLGWVLTFFASYRIACSSR